MGANTVTSTGNIGGGASPHSLTTPELPSHAHSYNTGTGAGAGGNQFARSETDTTNVGQGTAHTHNASANFSGGSDSVLQPYLTLVYIIKT
jgi:microcystin-dependent protein